MLIARTSSTCTTTTRGRHNASTGATSPAGWLRFQLVGKDAPSSLVVYRLKAAGQSGMLVPSFVTGATDAIANLVLWRWGPDLPHKVDAYDPAGCLPQNQLSWPKSTTRTP